MQKLVSLFLGSILSLSAAGCAKSPEPAVQVDLALPPVDTGRVAVEGSSLFYEAAGKGSPVVLLHAGYLDRRMWDDQFLQLSQSHRVIRFDARGYGRSGPVRGDFERWSDLLALMRSLKLTRAALVGVSLGGATAIDFSVRHPEMVDRLVLVGPGLSGYAWPLENMQAAGPVAARAALARGDTAGVARAWLLTDYLTAAREQPHVAAKLETILVDNVSYWKGLLRDGDHERDPQPTALGQLGKITAPTLVVVGSRDVPDILHIADSLRTKLPRARLIVFEGAGHVPNMEQPTRFTTLLTEFLAGR